jgi:Asp-tRNA(Asn)/Glu-tRNA(Gln) amidotransferase A subunit family amidase
MLSEMRAPGNPSSAAAARLLYVALVATFNSIEAFTANTSAGTGVPGRGLEPVAARGLKGAGARGHEGDPARGVEEHARARVSDVIAEVLEQAAADNSTHRIYTQIHGSSALRAVDSLSTRLTAPLRGVPVAIKDNIDILGADTSCGRRLAIRPAVASAAIVTRLVALGAIIIGKTNLDEAALGASGRNPRFGRCHNPRLADRLSGGSSSGSAAAVAAGHVLLGVGTDTMGSVRIPAAFCGIVGFKPSHGRLPTEGVAPLYPRFDSVGLLAGSLADIAQVARPLLAEDQAHRTSRTGALTVGVLDDPALVDVESGVARDYRCCVELLRGSHEYHVSPVPPIDWTGTARAALWEVAHGFAIRCSAAAPGFHPLGDIEGELGRLLERAANLPAKRLAAGLALLDESAFRLNLILRQTDALLTPTCPRSPPRIHEELPKNLAAFVAPANVAGLPAVAWTQRLGAADTVSLQLIGRHGEDLRLLDLASTVQRLLDRALAIEAPSTDRHG